MRILLAQKLAYAPALSGAAKLARLLLEQLAARMHSCRVLALSPDSGSSVSRIEVFSCNGVEVHVVPHGMQLNSYLLDQLKTFDPRCALISEDPTYGLLNAAVDAIPERTVFLSQSPATLPFGPESFTPDARSTELIGRAAGIVTSSRYLQSYFKRWSSMEAWWAPLPIYGNGPFRHLGAFDNPYVTLINPSAIKGISIFLDLARRFPDIEFAAVCTWATTEADRLELSRMANIRLLAANEDIDAIFAQTRVLVVPSLWGEALGMVAIEAMLRGIPVLASNVAGLPEAKLGVDYVLPVNPIERYEGRRDDRLIKVPMVPHQDLKPWAAALDRLFSDRNHYEDLSTLSRNAALAFVSGLSIEPFEKYLERISHPEEIQESKQATAELPESIRSLSPARLELLVQLLKKTK